MLSASFFFFFLLDARHLSMCVHTVYHISNYIFPFICRSSSIFKIAEVVSWLHLLDYLVIILFQVLSDYRGLISIFRFVLLHSRTSNTSKSSSIKLPMNVAQRSGLDACQLNQRFLLHVSHAPLSHEDNVLGLQAPGRTGRSGYASVPALSRPSLRYFHICCKFGAISSKLEITADDSTSVATAYRLQTTVNLTPVPS